ncbi:alpha-L-arabinofuranosidase C-terminal domain-containing protein [Flavihumibacter profundi]|uniref:alpha-L-arabinofuranosidase C-terminal domain-containing protein n=1 Tax=Flavihumibacter profundi TaxID=2716883 RepID=UPI001CC66A71|nr:alpha-L-arabinofuranosidase C-terminal domain-containing protein [Flavihumibacter profundi]MBZ5857515.1 alpha-L-arabinofuranosidase [Flavihumibacter profundi]
MKIRLLILALLAISVAYAQSQQPNDIIVKAGQEIAPVQPTMWGVFFEDINLGADGGIYAELVKNRSFEFGKPLMGWKKIGDAAKEGTMTILNRQSASTANPRFLRVKRENAGNGKLGLNNEGFRGMGIKKGLRYDFSFLYRQPQKGIVMQVELLDEKGSPIGSATVNPEASGDDWKTASVSFVANATCLKGSLDIWFENEGQIDLDMISLFPADTWKGRKGGLRADMVQMLSDMKPGFIRFPGGCIVEGIDLGNRYQWKKTIGPVEQRQQIMNRWNVEFAHRPTPDYYQTFGLGFLEYFQLAEDIGAAPLPILNCGMACQFNTAELVPLDQLDPYVQDALDLVEFANGDVTTKWGKTRADLGHPAPFNLQFLGVGNENWGPQYIERLKIFTKAIKEKYPYIRLINSSGTDPDGERFDYLNGALRAMGADIIDEHYYRRPEWFLQNAARYDSYDRKGSKVFAGEYAAQSDHTVSVDNRNNWLTAMSEAAFLTGLERNAEVVHMASYAPLFAHTDGWQWTPDLIWVDNLRVYGTPDYYVQKLFSVNKGTHVVSATSNQQPLTGQEGLYVSAVVDKKSGQLIVKVVNATPEAKKKNILVEGVKHSGTAVYITVLKSEELTSENSLDHPLTVLPIENSITIKGNKLPVVFAPNSLTIVKLPYRK